MKMQEAKSIMNIIEPNANGFMVSFERLEGCGTLGADNFPDKHAGEPLIENEQEAWALAEKFARATHGQCVNIYVIDANFRPVPGYKNRMIINR